MKQKQTSTNTNLVDSNSEIKSQAQLCKEAHDKMEAERESDPNWTAVITYRDGKTLKKKWVYDDSINDFVL